MLDESNLWTTTTVNEPEPDTEQPWRIGRIASATVTHTIDGKPDATVVRKSSFEYDANGRVEKETVEPDKAGSDEWLETVYHYDRYGYKNSVSTTGVVDTEGNQQTRTSTAVTRFDVANGQRIVTATNALNQSSTSHYSLAHGGLEKAIGINGLQSSTTYDGFGRVTGVFAPDGTWGITSRELCKGGCDITAHAVTQKVGSDGAKSWVYTDVLGREIASTSTALGDEIISAFSDYNARGFVSRKSIPVKGSSKPADSDWHTIEYDKFGRVVKETPPDTSRAGIVEYEYSGRTTTKKLADRAAVDSYTDINGKVHTQANSQALTGMTVQSVNNARGKLSLSIDSAGNDNTYDYDAVDSLVGTTDAAGRTTTLVHDSRGRKVSMQSPEMGNWRYRYNSFGELIEQTDAKNQVVSMQYDILGRLKQRQESEGVTDWTWDIAEGKGKGKLASVTSPGGIARSHVYDTLGRPAQTTVTVETASYSTTYGYDDQGRADRIAFPDSGLSVRNVFDEVGNLFEVQDARDDSLLWRAEAINAHGQITDQQFGNGLHTKSGYHAITAQLEWTQTRTRNEAGQDDDLRLSHYERYGYDTWGNMVAREDVAADTDLTDDQVSGVTELFAFDDINRLTHSTIDGQLTQVMAYGATGDIESKVSSVYEAANVGGYGYDPLTGRLIDIAGEAQTYDANGNQETGRGRTLTWTSFNKPRSIKKGDTTQYFAYNAERQRVLQIVGSKRTVMLDAALSGMAAFSVETDSDTGIKRYQLTVMAGGKPVATIVANQSKDADLAEAEHTNYLHVDRLGSVVMITDSEGKRISRTVFDAWGLRRGDQFGAVSDPFAPDLRHIVSDGGEFDRGFTQHQMLDDVGLIHMNARVYDPVLGRMLSADSIAPEPGYTQGLNRYAYVYNNPFGYTDPSGHKPSRGLSIIASIFNIVISTALSFAGVPPPIAHAIGGYVEGWIASGGDTDAAKAGARAGFVRGTFQWAAQTAGIPSNSWQSITLDAFAGGTASAANGGDFDTGFYNAGINSWVSAGIGEGASPAQVFAQATAGAISTQANGGDPLTGAVTSAFGRLYGSSQRNGVRISTH